jgi:hypothetical protein
MKNIMQALFADKGACRPFKEIDNANRLLYDMYLIDVMKKGSDKEIGNGNAIKPEQTPAKDAGAASIAIIELVNPLLQYIQEIVSILMRCAHLWDLIKKKTREAIA